MPGIDTVDDLRMRWVGHRLVVEATVGSDPTMPVGEFHELEHQAADRLRGRLPRVQAVRLTPSTHPGPADPSPADPNPADPSPADPSTIGDHHA